MTALFRTRRGAVLVATAIMALALLRNVGTPAENLAAGTMPNPDSYYKLVLLMDQDPEHGLGFVARDNAPYGNWIHWSRLHSESLWLLHLPLRAAGLEETAALRYAGGGLTILCMLLLTAFVAAAVASASGAASAVLAGMTLAASFPLHGYGKADQITHHVFMLVPLGAAAACLFSAARSTAGWREWVGGGLLGLALWISPETMPLVLGLLAVRMAMHLQGARTARLWPAAIALSATVCLGWLLDPPPPGFSAWALDHVSLAWLLLAALLSLLLLIADGCTARGLSLRHGFSVVSVSGLLLAAVWLLTVPGVLAGPVGLIHPELVALFWERVQELRPARAPTKIAAYAMLPLAGALVAGVMAARRRSLWLAALALMSLCYGLLALQHVRIGAAAAVAAALALGCGAGAHPAFRKTDSRQREAEGVAIALLPALQAIVVMVLALTTGGDEPPRQDCSLVPVAEALNALPPATVLTGVFHGPELLYRTHHRVIAGPYHHNADGMRDNFRSWEQTALEAPPAAFAERDIDLVLGCMSFQRDLVATGDRPTLAQRVASGDVPAWLEAMRWPEGIDTRWRLYRVRPDALEP